MKDSKARSDNPKYSCFAGRGSKGFDVLFWDGRAMKIQNEIISPFGNENPSDDLLEVAIHLPAVEIREMIIEDKFILDNKKEEAGTAMKVYSEIVSFVENRKESMTKLASFYNLDKSLIDFGHVAKSISEFMKKSLRYKIPNFITLFFMEENYQKRRFLEQNYFMVKENVHHVMRLLLY